MTSYRPHSGFICMQGKVHHTAHARHTVDTEKYCACHLSLGVSVTLILCYKLVGVASVSLANQSIFLCNRAVHVPWAVREAIGQYDCCK